MKDYYKTLSRADFPTWEEYMVERVKRGLAAGYTFQECYQHWLDEFEATLYRLTDEADGQTTPTTSTV